MSTAVSGDRSPRYLIRRLLPYAWRRRGPLAVVVASMVFDVGFTLLQPWPLKVLVDNVLRGRPLHGLLLSLFRALPGPDTRGALLTWTITATVVIFLLTWASGVIASVAAVRFGSQMSYDVAGDLFAHLQRLSLRFHTQHGIGSQVRRITSDSGAVATIIQDGGLPAISAAATLVAMIVVMLAVDLELTLVALAVIPPMAFIVRRYSSPMTERSYEQQEAEGEFYETIEQTLTGIAVVHAFGGETAADARVRTNTDRIMRATIRMTWAQSRFSLLLGAVTALGTAAVFWVGADQVLSGTISVGIILVFVSYLGSLYSPIHDVSHSSGTISESLGSALRVVEVLDAPADVEDRRGAVVLGGVRGEVAVEGVSFGYEV
ncbi:MAG: ATP-binding cassette, subfamily bacterial, partial [Solirubrobacteraceae bacterium]|nr:ATP-binding cassette, subfamily bacterial [Solirubrobacteraceae bacterium]